MRATFAFALPLVLTSAIAAADAPPPPPSPRPEVRVSRVVGSRSLRAVHARLRGLPLRDCQTTFLGGDVHAWIAIDPAGHVAVQRTEAAEEPRVYAACVARELGRAPFPPAEGPTRARVRVRFPSLGIHRASPTPL